MSTLTLLSLARLRCQPAGSTLFSLMQRPLGSRHLSRSPVPRSSAATATSEGGSSSQLPFVSTGIHEARFPQQEALEIHRRAARSEDPKYERRRRIGLVKIGLAIGAHAAFIVAVFLFFNWWAHAEDISP